MDMIGRIRRLHARKNKSEREISRMTGLSRNTVAKWLHGEVGGHVTDAVPGRDFLRLVELAADHGDDLDAVDQPDRIEVLGAEGSGAGQCDSDRTAHRVFSRIRWPTAVLEAGT